MFQMSRRYLSLYLVTVKDKACNLHNFHSHQIISPHALWMGYGVILGNSVHCMMKVITIIRRT